MKVICPLYQYPNFFYFFEKLSLYVALMEPKFLKYYSCGVISCRRHANMNRIVSPLPRERGPHRLPLTRVAVEVWPPPYLRELSSEMVPAL